MPVSVAGGSEDGETESDIVNLDELEAFGVGQADIIKLKSAHIHTVRTLAGTMGKALLKIRGFSDTKVDKLKEAADKDPSGGWMTGTDVLVKRKKCFRLSTGSKQWDAILNGGFQSMSTSEVFEDFRCGKTQLAHTLAVMAQLPRELGCREGKVAYLDAEGTFRPERIQQIAERFGIDPEAANDNITTCRAANSEKQSPSPSSESTTAGVPSLRNVNRSSVTI